MTETSNLIAEQNKKAAESILGSLSTDLLKSTMCERCREPISESEWRCDVENLFYHRSCFVESFWDETTVVKKVADAKKSKEKHGR